MKRIKQLLLLTTILSFNLFSQESLDNWEIVELKDKFGDKTGETVKSLFTRGKFSNTATSNEDMLVRVLDYGDYIKISLLEYNKPPEAILVTENRNGYIHIKRENGDEEKYTVNASGYGGMFIYKKSNKLLKLIREGNGEVIKVFLSSREFSIYGKSTYTFSLKTQENKI
ncbi:hypothetical protein [Polaribacter sp.]|uniref:hypothetical protein n=1 Tax=Polaribacter sp. TaxID=1920175 RepID=UPI0040471C21